MSRIDEALRRAAAAPPADRTTGAEGAVGLEDYPRERRAAPRPDPLPVRSGAAAPRDPFSRWRDDAALAGKLVTSGDMAPVAVEQYRHLAAEIHDLQANGDMKCLMATSALPGEGKSLTIVNLALTLSESFCRRVLLIDADLRSPSLHSIFHLPNTGGLSAVLRGGTSTPVAVSPRLDVLTAGPADADPMAGLTSARMLSLIEASGAQYDWVLLDAPPVLLLPDAQLLARAVGAAIFVIAAGVTPHGDVEKAVRALGRDFIVGTVLNRVEPHALPAAGYYRQYEVAVPGNSRGEGLLGEEK